MAGKDKVLRWVRIHCDEFDLSGDLRTFGSLDNNIGEIEMTGVNSTHHYFISDDVRVLGARAVRVLLNDAAGGGFAVLKNRDIARLSVAFGAGTEPTYSDPAYLLRSVQLNDPSEFEGGAAVLTSDFIPDGGQYDDDAVNPFGYVVRGAGTISATFNGDGVDTDRQTLVGGHAILHITATASGDYAFKLQDAPPPGSVWTDIPGAVFVLDGSVVGSEAIEFSGTIDQHIRFVATRTAGTVNVVCVAALN